MVNILKRLKTAQAKYAMLSEQEGIMGNLSGLATGIIAFAVVVVVGSVVLANLGNAVGGTANTTSNYLLTQLGSTSGGLASWTPAIIAVVIGVLFISLIAGGFGGKKF